MPRTIRAALILLFLGIITTVAGILSHLDYATAGTSVAHLRSTMIIGLGFIFFLGASWCSVHAFSAAKTWALLIVGATLASATLAIAVVM